MTYPSINEYIEAIRFAEDNFDQLKHLRPVLGGDGKPVMTSGNFAVVFQMKDEQTGKLHAVKCFLREQEGRAEAYRQIAEELEYVSSTFLTPIKYLDKELFVDSSNSEDSEFPVLLMDWVEGQTLDKYIREQIDDQYELSLLAYQFSRLAMWLMPQPFAHGDLKPDNILVKEDGTLVLVDYDGMYVPAMKGQKARELGSPDFRHPDRTEDVFDDHIDDFCLASILLSLKAIALQPSLLEEYGASDRLLFSETDYRNLSESKVMDALKPLMQDAELASLYSLYILALSQNNLSQVSFRLFNLSRPDRSQYEDENLSTEVTEEDLANAWTDEYGVKYSRDKKRLLKASNKDVENIVNCWTLLEFAKSHGRMKIGVFTNPETGETYKGCAFVDQKSNNVCFVYYSSNLGELTAAEIIANKDNLLIIQLKVDSEALSRREKNKRQLESYFLCKTYPLRTYSVRKGTKVICDNAFSSYEFLNSIELPNSIISIGNKAFSGCRLLAAISLPNRLKRIGDKSFDGCASLSSIILSTDIEIIGNWAFARCSSLTTIVIPNNLKKIGRDIFMFCNKIVRISIPHGELSRYTNLFPQYVDKLVENDKCGEVSSAESIIFSMTDVDNKKTCNGQRNDNPKVDNLEVIKGFVLPDGSIYNGEGKVQFGSVELCGQGEVIYKNGDKYIGSFKYGRPLGWGKYIFTNGHTHRGYFDTFPKGIGYLNENYGMTVGNYDNGKLHGWGIYYRHRIFKFGYWDNGKLVRDQSNITLWIRAEITNHRFEYKGNLIQIAKEHDFIRFGIPQKLLDSPDNGIPISVIPKLPAWGFEFFKDGIAKVGMISNHSSGEYLLCKPDGTTESGKWKDNVKTSDFSSFKLQQEDEYEVDGLDVYKKT